MRTIKFRFRLKLICDNWGKYKKGDIDVFYITLESLCRFPIDAHWEILSQDEFTELTDKNGVEIYEGDVCKTRDSTLLEGEYSDLLICDNFNDFIYTVMFSEDHSGLNGYTQKDLEVIGNIYQNGEQTEQ